ncbi:MAG: hypothetical protein ABIU05_11805 [Nitrospirales bacterium]
MNGSELMNDKVVTLHWITALSFFAITYVAIFLSLSSAVWIPTAHHDNTRYFRSFDTNSKSSCTNDGQYGWLHLIGRPLTAKLECQVFKHAGSLHDLNNMRIGVIAILALGASALGALLYRFGFDILSSWLTAVAIFILPGAQNAVFMTNFPNALAALCSMLAYWCLEWGPNINKYSYLMPILGAMFLLFIAMLMYPALAFVFLWGTLAKVLCYHSGPTRQAISIIVRDGAVLFSSGLAYLLLRDLFIPNMFRIHLDSVPDAFKPDLSISAVVGKLPFLFDKAIPTATDLWFFDNELFGECVVSLFWVAIFMSVVLKGRGDGLSRYNLILKFAIVIGLILASSIPLVVNKQPFLHQRLLWPTMGAVLIATLGVMTVAFITVFQPRGDMVIAFRRSICALVGIGSLIAASYTTTLNVWNTNMEMEFVRGELARSDITPRRIHFVRSIDNGIGFNTLKSFSDEFNKKTTDFKQDIRDFVSLAYMGYSSDYKTSIIECDFSVDSCEEVVPKNSIILSISEYGEKFCMSQNMVVVDLNILVRATRTGDPKLISTVHLPKCHGK